MEKKRRAVGSFDGGNVAAHAFVKHFLRLGFPELVGRLVGYVEMKKGPANQTALDIPPAFRNDVLRNKQVLVGCEGGFHQECQQPYSPVASWMEDTDVALNDEGQQYGNLDEASAIARAPRKCLMIWCGDHKQSPGGLRKTDEAKAFRRKLLRRPIALRGDTEHFQPNMLGKVVLRYLEGMDEPLILLSSHPSDPQALQAAIQQFRASKRAKVEVAQIPRQPPPCGPPPPPAPPDPMSPHPKPPPSPSLSRCPGPSS